jgi:drug/metabolite transporter (DMT)-like permease
MSVRNALKLLLLAIIWGASFLLMRIAAPEFGPVPLILVRGLVAVACCSFVFRHARNRALFRKNARGLLFLGLVNTALPFSLLAYATLSLEVGFTSLLNATTPIFAAVIGAAAFATPLRRPQVIGLVIALAGVVVLSWGDRLSFKPGGSGLAVAAALVASMSYGVSANFTKHRLAKIPPQVVSASALSMASLLLLAPGIWLWPDVMPSAKAWLCALLLGVICTAFAYALFFELLSRTGAMAATSVTFLIPVFAILWGASILHEGVDHQIVAGMIVTLAGTALTVGLIAPAPKLAPPA